ncbi:hypothetical protein DV738_g383, partial [Chaetothyriales sp. CBS 135597]
MSTAHSMPPNAFFNRNKDYHYDDTTRSKTASSSTLNVAGGYSSSQRPIKAIALFTAPQIYPDMIFFDDEARNRNVETDLGVTFVLVRDGLTRDDVDRGVWEWRMRREQQQQK